MSAPPSPNTTLLSSLRQDLQRLSIDLTSAQILALFTTPVQIVPAPPAGFRIVPVLIEILFTGGSVAYLDGGGGAVTFALGAAGPTQALASNAVFLVTVSPNRRTQIIPWAGDTDTAGNPPTSDAVALFIQKATANFTAGNGTARVNVYFLFEPTK
jgi:hypothetical protein